MSEDTALQALFDGTLRNSSGNVTNALLVYGAPNTGKTQFAVRAAISGVGSVFLALKDARARAILKE